MNRLFSHLGGHGTDDISREENSCTENLAVAQADILHLSPAEHLATTDFVIANRHGRIIRSVEDWERLAPPKSRNHWKDGRSAKELARAWFRLGHASVPSEVGNLLATNETTRRIVLTKGIAEYPSHFDNCRGEPSNVDLMLYAHADGLRVVLAEEAKADESFADTVEKTLQGAHRRPRTNFPTRFVCCQIWLYRWD